MSDLFEDLSGSCLGNYTLIRLLGEGGFARVYLGEHMYLQRQAAIKVLRSHLLEEQIEAFQIEARNVSRLQHPNIVQVLDYGVELGQNIPYIVMTYARGTLRQLYPYGAIVPLSQAVSYIAQAAEALYYAYNDFRLIHRDVKPENMLLGQSGELLVSDFGMAQVIHSSNLQAKMTVEGTIAYMAPEQVQGYPGPASDQYALAVVAYEWLWGIQPFRGSVMEVATQHLVSAPVFPKGQGQAYPPDVEAVLRVGLAKDPKQRFANVRAFATALMRASGLSRAALVPGSQPLPVASLQASPLVLPLSPKPAYPRPVAPQAVQDISTFPIQPQPSTTPPAAPLAAPSAPPQVASPATPRKTRQLPRREILLGLGGVVVGGVVLEAASKLFSASPAPVAGNPPGVSSTPATNTIPSASPTPAVGTVLYTYTGHQQGLDDLAWSPDGKRIASGGMDKVVRVWDALTGGHTQLYSGHTDLVNSVVWFPDGRLIASGASDGTIQVWDAKTMQTVYKHTQGTIVQCIACSPDGKRVVSGGNNTMLQVWDATSGAHQVTYTGHSAGSKNYIIDVAWCPKDERIASACDDETVRIWDGRNGQKTYVTHQHVQAAPMWAVSWSPDGKYIASGDKRGVVEVWDASSGKRLLVYNGHKDRVDVLAWSLTGQLIASAGYDNTVQIWRASDGGLVYSYNHHRGAVYDVIWSPDVSLIASCGADKTAQVWQAPRG